MAPEQSTITLIVRSWAAGRPNVLRSWLYGSRIPASGKMPRDNSDWDVAIQIAGNSTDAVKEWWFPLFDSINKELQLLAGWDVHVEIFNPPETPNVESAIANYAVLIYEQFDTLVDSQPSQDAN